MTTTEQKNGWKICWHSKYYNQENNNKEQQLKKLQKFQKQQNQETRNRAITSPVLPTFNTFTAEKLFEKKTRKKRSESHTPQPVLTTTQSNHHHHHHHGGVGPKILKQTTPLKKKIKKLPSFKYTAFVGGKQQNIVNLGSSKIMYKMLTSGEKLMYIIKCIFGVGLICKVLEIVDENGKSKDLPDAGTIINLKILEKKRSTTTTDSDKSDEIHYGTFSLPNYLKEGDKFRVKLHLYDLNQIRIVECKDGSFVTKDTFAGYAISPLFLVSNDKPTFVNTTLNRTADSVTTASSVSNSTNTLSLESNIPSYTRKIKLLQDFTATSTILTEDKSLKKRRMNYLFSKERISSMNPRMKRYLLMRLVALKMKKKRQLR